MFGVCGCMHQLYHMMLHLVVIIITSCIKIDKPLSIFNVVSLSNSIKAKTLDLKKVLVSCDK